MKRFLVYAFFVGSIGFALLYQIEYSQTPQERRAVVETITLEDGTRCAIYGEGRKGFEGRAGGITCDWECER